MIWSLTHYWPHRRAANSDSYRATEILPPVEPLKYLTANASQAGSSKLCGGVRSGLSPTRLALMLAMVAVGASGSPTSPMGQTIYSVVWAGADNLGGSGLRSVLLFYRKDRAGEFQQYGGEFTASPILFDLGTTGGYGVYEFYTLGVDNVGNVEAKSKPDLTVSLIPTGSKRWRDYAIK